MDQMLLRPDDAARILGIGRSKTYDLIRRGEIPSMRLGASVRVPVDALRRWIEEQTQVAASAR